MNRACGAGRGGAEEDEYRRERREKGVSQVERKRKEQTGLERPPPSSPPPHPHPRAGTRAEKRSRARPETGGEQHPSSPTGPIWKVGRSRNGSRKQEEWRRKEAPPWRYMRMASSRREPRSWARSRGTSSCRRPASQWSPEGRSSSLLLLTRREDAERGSPAQPSATGRKQCTKCSFDFLTVSMRASCQRERDRPRWILGAQPVPRRASPLLAGWQVSHRRPRHAKPGQLHPHEARGATQAAALNRGPSRGGC